MRHPNIYLTLVIPIICVTSYAYSQRDGDHRNGAGVLGILAKDQAVTIKDVAGRYEIGVMPDMPMLGYKVVDVGQDYVVVQDVAQITELRIPIYSVKAVSVMHVGRR